MLKKSATKSHFFSAKFWIFFLNLTIFFTPSPSLILESILYKKTKTLIKTTIKVKVIKTFINILSNTNKWNCLSWNHLSWQDSILIFSPSTLAVTIFCSASNLILSKLFYPPPKASCSACTLDSIALLKYKDFKNWSALHLHSRVLYKIYFNKYMKKKKKDFYLKNIFKSFSY